MMSAETFSFRQIAKVFEKIRHHIVDYELLDRQKAYPGVRKRIEDARDLYIHWMDVCEEYRVGFQKMKMDRPVRQAAMLLSSLGTGVENSFFEVAKARIPSEVYFLVQYFYETFSCESNFVLASGAGFELESIRGEIDKELQGFEYPIPEGTQADTYLTTIRNNDYTKIYYESVMYDSPLTWPLLLHEVFHEIYEKEKIASVLRLPFSEPWVPEVVIDLYAAIFFGPVYAVSLAEYHERYPGGGGVSHPTEGARLYGLLKLLEDLSTGITDFSDPVQKITKRSYNLVNEIWSHYRREKRDIQERVRQIYEKVKKPAIEFIRVKEQLTFEELVTQKKIESGKDFERVVLYRGLGVPIAANPRILFNALVDPEKEPEYEYVSESLKKWYLSNSWSHLPARKLTP